MGPDAMNSGEWVCAKPCRIGTRRFDPISKSANSWQNRGRACGGLRWSSSDLDIAEGL